MQEPPIPFDLKVMKPGLYLLQKHKSLVICRNSKAHAFKEGCGRRFQSALTLVSRKVAQEANAENTGAVNNLSCQFKSMNTCTPKIINVTGNVKKANG